MKQEPKPFTWTQLMRAYVWILGTYKKKYFAICILLFFLYLSGILPAFITGRVVDILARNPRLSEEVVAHVVALGLIMTTFAIVRLGVKQSWGNIRSDVMYNLKVRGFEQLLERQSLSLGGESTGARVQALQNGIDQFVKLWRVFDNTILTTLSALLGSFVLLITSAPWYFIALLLGYAAVAIFITDYFTGKRRAVLRDYYSQSEKTSGVFVEGITNAVTVKVQGAQRAFKNRVAKEADLHRRLEYRTRDIVRRKWQLFQVFNGITFAVMIGTAVQSYIVGLLSLGMIASVNGYLMRIVGGGIDFMDSYDELVDAREGISRMMPIFWDKIITWPGNDDFPKRYKAISFQNLHFRYGENKEPIKDFSLFITRGEKIGIRGETGSGKSTLAKLLVGLLRPEEGKILIDKKPLESIRHSDILRNIVLIQQETELFALSVRENITLMQDIPDKTVALAMNVAQLTPVIEGLPEGLDTVLGEKGYQLSGGERQRVAIARALCKSAPILILDEATSALDVETEKRIVAGLEEHFPTMTMIVIAHRPHALALCDRVYEVRSGVLIEQVVGAV